MINLAAVIMCSFSAGICFEEKRWEMFALNALFVVVNTFIVIENFFK